MKKLKLKNVLGLLEENNDLYNISHLFKLLILCIVFKHKILSSGNEPLIKSATNIIRSYAVKRYIADVVSAYNGENYNMIFQMVSPSISVWHNISHVTFNGHGTQQKNTEAEDEISQTIRAPFIAYVRKHNIQQYSSAISNLLYRINSHIEAYGKFQLMFIDTAAMFAEIEALVQEDIDRIV